PFRVGGKREIAARRPWRSMSSALLPSAPSPGARTMRSISSCISDAASRRGLSLFGRRRSLFRIFGPGARAGLGQDDLRVVGLGLDLLAELADVNAQVLRVLGVRRAPDCSEDLLVGYDLAGVPCEERQQLELSFGELHLVAAACDAVTDVVD